MKDLKSLSVISPTIGLIFIFVMRGTEKLMSIYAGMKEKAI